MFAISKSKTVLLQLASISLFVTFAQRAEALKSRLPADLVSPVRVTKQCHFPGFNASCRFLPCLTPSPSQSSTIAVQMTNSASSETKRNNRCRHYVSVRVMENLFYAVTSPFPALRRVLLSRRQDQNNDEDPNRAMDMPMRRSLLTLGAYLGVGVLSYHFLIEKWSIVDAIYFSCVCFSTVG